MKTILSLLSVLFVFIYSASAQILPREGGMLNYRLIGFSCGALHSNDKYKLELAMGYFDNADSFKKNIFKTVTCTKGKIITEVPYWGAQYTWRIVDVAKVFNMRNELYHFGVILNPEMDTANVRLRILHKAEKYKDAFVLLDNNKAMYDMSGKPLWFLPAQGFANGIRDLQLTSDGTITFLDGQDAAETANRIAKDRN